MVGNMQKRKLYGKIFSHLVLPFHLNLYETKQNNTPPTATANKKPFGPHLQLFGIFDINSR